MAGDPVNAAEYAVAEGFAPEVARLTRTRGGRMLHRTSCRYAKGGAPWNWAQDKWPWEVADVVRTMDYAECKHCAPLCMVAES